MTGNELLAEAERLARPCTLLTGRGHGKEFAAVWGGPGVVPAPEGPFRHWLSIDCRFLPGGQGPSSGCLSVYTDEDACDTGAAVHSQAAALGLPKKGRGALYAFSALSLPPIDAVFWFGGEAVQSWLRKVGWQPGWGYNGNFPDAGPAEEYQRRYQAQCPLYAPEYAGGVAAVLGGWHFPWPDGDWEQLLDRKLLVWTFADSEPWVEVWEGPDGLTVLPRIT